MKKLGVLLLLLVAACGKRGDPRPPVPIIPQATTDLVVTQRGSRVILSWSYPSLTTAGQSLRDVRRVVVYRVAEQLPVPQGGRDPNTMLPGDVDVTGPRALSLFSRIPLLSPTQFNKLRERVDSIEGANLPDATAGARLLYDDTPPFQTADGRALRYTYAVATETATARGAVSNLARIVPLPAPAAPSSVTAKAEPAGVMLQWSQPDAADSAAQVLAGYNVYRSTAGQALEALSTPLNAAPVSGPSYTDVPPYGSYSYVVRAVAATSPLIESDSSAPATASFKDLLPPPAPATVTALIETRSVRVVWDPVVAADLGGYRLYRVEGSGNPPVPVAPGILFTPVPLTVTNWTDNNVQPGIAYFYEIASIDKTGNESARTKTEWVLVPKAP